MRRSDLIRAVSQLTEALTESDMRNALLGFLQPAQRQTSSKAPDMEDVLQAFSIFSLKASRFEAATHELVQIFNLDGLANPSTWAAATSDNGPMLINQLFQSVRFIEGFLPSIAAMLETDANHIEAVRKSEPLYSDAETLSVIVVEEDHEYSDVRRITHLLEAVSILYDVCAEVNGDKPDKLRLIGCDSGSDKSFDFLGHGKTIECVKDTFFQLWDRIAFYKERRSEEQVKTIIASLPAYEQIGDMEQKDKIDHERAERLRHQLDSSLERLYTSGVYVAEAQDRIKYDPRRIAAPQQKLLTGSDDSQTREDMSDTISYDLNRTYLINELLYLQINFWRVDRVHALDRRPVAEDRAASARFACPR